MTEFAVAVAAVYVILLVLSYWAGQRIAERAHTRELASAPNDWPMVIAEIASLTTELRCECRRYAAPSPLCPRHGKEAA